jgi:peptidoglycan/xylan/chitin deacetylase (PgdA/CDA1 family)
MRKRHWPRGLARVLAICAILAGLLPATAGVAGAQAAPAVTVSLTFNDGFVNQYLYAKPLLKSHNMNGTFYLTSGAIDKGFGCCVAWWQADELYRDGNELGGMGRDRVDLTQVSNPDPAQDYAYKRSQVCDDRARLVQLGYDPQSFAYPYGAYNYTFPDGTTVKGIVQGCGYRSGQPVGGLSASGPAYAETIPPADAYALRTGAVSGSPVTLASLQDAVNAASANGGGWLPVVFDQVCHQGAADYTTCMNNTWHPIDDTVFGAFLDWLGSAGQSGGAPAGTTVRTVRQVMGAPAQPPLPIRPTVVSLTFDDGLRNQAQTRNMFLNRGLRATFFLVSGDIDRRDPGAMTWAQARSLNADGHDIGGHTRDHVDMKDPNTTNDFKTHQVCDDRQRLIQQQLGTPVSFAYPFGSYDANAEAIVRSCGYTSGRSAGNVSVTGPNYSDTIPPRDAFGTWALNAQDNGPITLAYMQDAVRATASHGGGWLQMIFHDVCFAGSSYSACMQAYRPVDSAALNQFLGWLKSTSVPAGTSVKTVRQVITGT